MPRGRRTPPQTLAGRQGYSFPHVDECHFRSGSDRPMRNLLCLLLRPWLPSTTAIQTSAIGENRPDGENRTVSAHGRMTAVLRFKFCQASSDQLDRAEGSIVGGIHRRAACGKLKLTRRTFSSTDAVQHWPVRVALSPSHNATRRNAAKHPVSWDPGGTRSKF